MKIKPLTKKSVTVMLFITVVVSPITTVFAAYSPTPAADFLTPQKQEALATKREILEEKHKQIEFEALAAVSGAQNALMAFKKNDSKRALVLLNDATKQLNMVSAKYPESNLVPAIIDAEIYDFDGDTQQVEKLIKKADGLIEDDRIQDARQMLDQLVSEVHVTTISVPLGSFSMGVKDAADIASSGNVEKAEDVLYEVLNRLVKTTEIMVLPVLKAQGALKLASKLEHQSNQNQDANKTEILALFDAAKDKLKLAALLGYGAKDDYTSLNDAIDNMKDLIFTDKSTEGWNKVIAALSGLEDRLTRLK